MANHPSFELIGTAFGSPALRLSVKIHALLALMAGRQNLPASDMSKLNSSQQVYLPFLVPKHQAFDDVSSDIWA